jgi:copper chaperone CopZ
MRRMFRELFGYIRGIQVDVALAQTELEKGSTVADVHVYVTRPAQKEGAALEDIEGMLRNLDYVSGVEVSPTENVVAVSFEGGKTEQDEIKRTVEETGYEVSRLSVRTTFAEERNLWEI